MHRAGPGAGRAHAHRSPARSNRRAPVFRGTVRAGSRRGSVDLARDGHARMASRARVALSSDNQGSSQGTRMIQETDRWDRVKHVFQAALGRRPDTRSAFLVAACDDDQLLRAEVHSLLLAHEAAGSFAERPAIDGLAAPDMTPHSLVTGRQIGPYQI